MLISVIVPVYNEQDTIEEVLTTLSNVPLHLEVIVVDDASTDQTWETLQTLRTRAPFDQFRYIRHERNQGKGAGLRTGFRETTGDLVTIQDADLEYDPQDIPTLVKRWENANEPLTVIYGRRNLSEQKFFTRWGNRFLTQMTNLLFGSHIHDMETCYKLIPASMAHALPMTGKRFEIEPEITSHILKAGYRILEVPISYAPREAKKLSPWKDGWPALAMLFKCRFSGPFRAIEQAHTSEDRQEKIAANN